MHYLFDRLLRDERFVPEQSESPFTLTYFAFIAYFQELYEITSENVIIGANFTYGWMPTMLRLKNSNFEEAAEVLRQAKFREALTNRDMQVLIDLMNNSIVGVSKLLHFVNPEDYAIWDSRVAAYLDPDMSYYSFQRTATYREYLAQCCEVSQMNGFSSFKQTIDRKVGRSVTALRAIELVMYSKGG
jgi:hypothetical protein